MPQEKLRVLVRGTAQVPDYEKQFGGINARIGWKCQPLGPEFIDPETRQPRRHAAFVPMVGEVVEVPVRPEYLRHLRDGDLWPADQATAQIAGVKFDSSFGGEHGKDAKDAHAEELAALTKPAAPAAAKGA